MRMFKRFVHWLIFISIVLGVVGIIVQWLRWGAIIEPSAWTGL